ncbi:hypothetical protein [Bacillus chungangensis]|uniref:NUDIX family phosphoesterase n=1 Tax=Bacillus chungangensis TaxID=587633 RepID=A0ABT9WUU5_9BACI|nr:hypothetical protein [Bacillus chungangensis]MDQ0177055.1 putative NUDIX family phosphoesterase [Bacillus chungangensis]
MNKMDEMIIVAPRTPIFENEKLTFQGICKDKTSLEKITKNMAITYSVMRRGDAEENFDFKQPIPYVVLKRKNEVYAYKRLRGGGEKRLHSKISIGLGGHCNDVDNTDFDEMLYENLKRELSEEVRISNENFKLKTIGLINDDKNDVGRVHLGILLIAELEENTSVSVRETEQLEGFWINIKDLKNNSVYINLESWSQFVADILNG